MGIPYDPNQSIPDFLFSDEIDIDAIEESQISKIAQIDIVEEYTRKMREELK